MALYVLAFTDVPVDSAGGESLTSEAYDGMHAICQERSSPPEPSDEQLRHQHALVVDLADRCRAILPVRFGTLLSARQLRKIVREHRVEFAASMALVRDRRQMTVRVTGRRAPGATPGPGETGRHYLERKQGELHPQLSAPVRRLLDRVRPLAAAERMEPGAGALLATVYHLVDIDDLTRYSRALANAPRTMLVTGPWPPFAFTPRLS